MTTAHRFYHLVKQSLQRLPNPCLLCGQSILQERLCTGCTLNLPYLDPTHACDSCALPLETEASYCGHCLSTPPPFERCRATLVYDFPLDRMIHQFKYHRQLTQGRALSQLMIESLQAARAQTEPEQWPELIVPVPMHWTRRWRRGFNHTEVLGYDLAQALGLALHSRLCHRQRRTPTQQGLSRSEREQNLNRAFALKKGAEAILAGRRVALLDDVVTTTSTAREISRLLLKAGAAQVEVWALARTPQVSGYGSA